MMMGHTPGPYKVRKVEGSFQVPFHVVAAGGKTVAQCVGNQLRPDETSIGEAKANATLFAAAPDLLTALKRLLGEWEEAIAWEESYMGIADFARKVIAKAEGKSR